jgi:hypothetical protein
MTVHNFGVGDSIDLTNLAWSLNVSLAWDSNSNSLIVSNGTSNESIHFAEGHSAGDFSLAHDPLGTGGIDVVYNNSSFNYGSATSYTVVPLPGTIYFMGGINDAGIALVTGGVLTGSPVREVSDNYFYINGHLVSLPGSPLTSSFNVGEVSSGINNNQKIVIGFQDTAGDESAMTYLGTYDASTNLFTGTGGATANFTGPGILKTSNQPSYLGEGLGINDNDVIVGFFTDATGLARQQASGDQSHVFTINGPPGAGFSGNPLGNLEHEYGFILKNGVYTLINAGSSSNRVNGTNDPSPGVSYFGNANAVDGVAYTVLTDINNAGIAVGYYMDGRSVQHAFIFNTNTHTFTFIPDQNYGSGNGQQITSTLATSINNSGLVVGFYGNAFATNAELSPYNSVRSFVYDSNTNQFLTTNFTLPGGGSIGLTGINDTGQVSGESGQNLIVASLRPIVNIDDGGTLYQTTNTLNTIHFAGPTGKLVLSAGFSGQITGFNGTGGSEALSDTIDLVGINWVETANFHVNYFAATGVLNVSEGLSGGYSLNFVGYSGGFIFAADGHGGTLIFDPPSGGETTIADGTMYMVTGADDGTITFAGTQGKLQLEDATTFTGTIKGFANDAAHSDAIDLTGFDAASTVFTQKSVNGNLVVTATEGDKVATLTFDHVDGALNFANDGFGGTVITNSAVASGPEIGTVDATVTEAGVHGTITATDPGAAGTLTTSVKAEGADYVGEFSVHTAVAANGTASVDFNFDFNPNSAPSQAVTQSYDIAVKEGATTVLHQTVSVSVASANADNFVFTAGVGADTIVNFDLQHDTIDLSHFENIQSVQQLASMTTSNSHGDAVIDLGNHDSITIAGVTAAQLQQVMQSVVHLH